jgi:hypothetical protein
MATAKKTAKKKERALDIAKVLEAVDYKNYKFYDKLDDLQLKEFSPYVLMRFVSNINSNDRELQEWFVEMTNELVNKNHWDLSKNDEKLLWLLYTAVGAGIKSFHPYLPALKKELNKIEKLLAELHPTYKLEDIKLLAKLMTDREKKELLDDMGFDKKERKEYE